MKILVIHPHLSVTGGSEVLTKTLVGELARLGHRVSVLTSSIGDEFPGGTGGVKLYLFGQKGCGLEGYRGKVLQIYMSLARIFDSEQLDAVLVMIQEPVYNALVRLVSPETTSAIYIHYPHEEELTGENLHEFLEMFRFPGLYEELYGMADVRMANSTYTARVLYRRYGIAGHVVYPAISWEYFEEEPDPGEARGRTIITVGRFVPQKRVERLIQLFRERILREVPDARLLIVGVRDPRYPYYYEELRAAAEAADNVELVDKPLPASKMAEYYRMARVYVHMRVGEHFGMAPVEAMSQAVIPVIPERSGLAELVSDGFDGFTYATDEEAVAKVIKILKSGGFPDIRRRCYLKAQYFNPRRFAQEVLSYIKFPEKRRS